MTVSLEAILQEFPPHLLRGIIEQQITELIDVLDQLDGDADFEPTGDEDDTGMPDKWRTSGFEFPRNTQSEILEDDEEGDVGEDNGDDEYSLGAPEQHPNPHRRNAYRDGDQTHWCKQGNHGDREDDGDDMEPSTCQVGYHTSLGVLYDLEGDTSDEEASLGWPAWIDQGCIAMIDTSNPPDLEHDDSDLEPWLAWPEGRNQASDAAVGDDRDLEVGDGDDEESEGWPEYLDQTRREAGAKPVLKVNFATGETLIRFTDGGLKAFDSNGVEFSAVMMGAVLAEVATERGEWRAA